MNALDSDDNLVGLAHAWYEAPIGSLRIAERHRNSNREFAWVCSLTYPSMSKRDELLSPFQQAGANWYLESWGTGPFEKQMRKTKKRPPEI